MWIKLSVSNGNGRGTDNKDNGLAYTSRVEWLSLGNFHDEGDYYESDLYREPKPKFSVGAVYSMNKKAVRPGGQLGEQYVTPGLNTDIETWFLDALYKYKGFSWSSEYAKRWTPDSVFLDERHKLQFIKDKESRPKLGMYLIIILNPRSGLLNYGPRC